MLSELPASDLYSPPSLGLLWQKVHLLCSPYVVRRSVQKLYERPAPALLSLLTGKSYHWIALGCADAQKESLLSKKIPTPASFHAADTNLQLARRGTERFTTPKKSYVSIDLTSPRMPSSILRVPKPWFITLFGVLPNLDPLPLLRRLSREMQPGDLLLLSANLAPGKSGFVGARKILQQYENPPTREWLEAAVARFRPRLPKGHLVFDVFPDPRQKSLARIEARWISGRRRTIVFSSRRPTPTQVESWVRKVRLRTLGHFVEPRREEGIWLVTR